MPTFLYQGVVQNERRDGEVEAADRRSAITVLRRMGINPLELTEAKAHSAGIGTRRESSRSRGLSLGQGLKAKDITAMTRQLSTLMSSGFPLARALGFIRRQAEKEALRQLVADLDEKVRGGSTLSDSLMEHPRYFDSLYVSMIQAGESGGILETLLDRLAAMREADEVLVSKVKGALTYPALMALAMLGSLVVMFAYVVPQFALMFKDMGQALPTPTRIMMDVASVFQTYWWAILLGVVAIVAGPKLWGRTPAGRRALDQIKLRLPVIGGFATQVAMARLCRTMGTLLDSGVNLIAALDSSRGVAGNVVIAEAVSSSMKEIREGKKVGQTFAATGVFPDLVCEMITLGEESGQIGRMMIKVSEVYERQTDELVKALTSILEPVMILFMGGVVGLVVVAMLMPIFSMNITGG